MKKRKTRRMAHPDSILQPGNDRTCYLCGKLNHNFFCHNYLETHHIFGGPNRKISEMQEMKENKIVESLCQVDFSELNFPMATIYEKPLDFPNEFVARVWDGKGAKPTNIIIKRATVQEIREDIRAAGFTTVFARTEDDDPNIVEIWI